MSSPVSSMLSRRLPDLTNRFTLPLRLLLVCIGTLWALAVPLLRADTTVVFNEIMYHPVTNEADLEWIELHNQMAVDMELSGWRLSDGIQYAFPEGTVIPGKGYLVIALNPSALQSATGITNVLGPFSGRLSNSGEKIKLRNNNDRLMDEVDYGMEGDWPCGPDGAGVSLAKADEDGSSSDLSNWRMSAQFGGTPGMANFPVSGISITNQLVMDSISAWRFDDSGADLGTDWRGFDYDDSSWAWGNGLFAATNTLSSVGVTQAVATLFSSGIGNDGTPLASGTADPHYSLVLSAYSTPPPPALAATAMAGHANWLGNDAVSTWIGPVSSGTINVPAGPYHFETTFDLSGYDLTTVRISIQVAVDNELTNLFLNGSALGFTYNTFSNFSTALILSNGFLSGTNILSFRLNNSGTTASPAGLRVKASGTGVKLIPVNTRLAQTATARYFRRTFPFTSNPSDTLVLIRPALSDGAVFYLNGTECLRWNMPSGAISSGTLAATNVPKPTFAGPFAVSGSMLQPGMNLISAELHSASPNPTQALFGTEITLVTTNYPPPPPPTLALNEMPAVTNGVFWVELVNYSTQNVTLSGNILARFGKNSYYEYLIPNQTLSAGQYLVLDKAAIGFGADPGDKVVLYSADKASVLDAVVAKSHPRARWPDGAGRWLHPGQLTPGATNDVPFNREIVINEILYHHPDLPVSPEVRTTNLLVSLTNVWKYDQSGTDMGSQWMTIGHPEVSWLSGPGLFYAGFSSLPAPRNTLLVLSNAAGQGITTYYFRTSFNITNPFNDIKLLLNHVLDDGAVFYLNGVEIYRYGMAAGPVNYLTRAINNVGIPALLGPFSLPTNLLVMGSNLLAVEVHQFLPPPGSKDIAFGAELSASWQVTPALPPRESPEAWIELYNQSPNSVDLTGWQFDKGINYSFPPGKIMAPGSYLLVARDPDYLRTLYPDKDIIGGFASGPSKSGGTLCLVSSNGNPACTVHYYDGYPWPEFADGGGSTLELMDPRADLTRPEAWAASDESARSAWTNVSYRGIATVEPAASPTLWKEFVLGLLGEGEILLDDLSVIESPAGARKQLIQNGTFESGINAWRCLGTHRLCQVVTDPGNANNHVLRVIARGGTEHMHNHVETTLASGASITNGTEYEISFKARWIAGCNKLNTRLYFNRLAKTVELPMPARIGTPGARNSRYAGNIGPTFFNLLHQPAVPAASQPVTITARAADPDGIASARLLWSVNGGTWLQTNLDILANGMLQGTLPGQAAGAVVQFHIEATDGLGVSSTHPAGGTNSSALFEVSDGQALMTRLHSMRLIMPPASAAFLHTSTNVMSNERLGCTLIYDENRIFYNARLHLQGSERGRDNTQRVGFSVKVPADNLFRGQLDGFTIDRSGGYSGKGGRHDEILLKHAVNRCGQLPGMYDDLVQVFAPRANEDGTGLLILAKYGDTFLDGQFKNGSDGEMYKLELIYYPTTTAGGDVQSLKLPQPDTVLNTDIKDLGADKENYRWTFLKENHVENDNYAPMMSLAKAFSLTGSALDAETQKLMDVNEWMRATAFLALIGVLDMYTYGNSHNLIIYFRPEDQKGMMFIWDMDYSFVAATNYPFPGTGSPTTLNIINLPGNLRRYHGHLQELLKVTGDKAYMNRWASHYAGLLGQNWSSAVDYLNQRATWVSSQLPGRVPFAITNNNGQDFMTTNAFVVLGGTAWIDTADIGLQGITNRLAVYWLTTSNWQASIPLMLGTNRITLLGYDFHGATIATQQINITCTAASGAPDTDGDGMPDQWEIAHGLNPNFNDAALDMDGDGSTNLQEYMAGTDPFNPESFLQLQASQSATTNNQIAFPALAGRSYTVQQRFDLSGGAWTRLPPDLAPVLTNRFILINLNNNTNRYFRLVTPNVP